MPQLFYTDSMDGLFDIRVFWLKRRHVEASNYVSLSGSGTWVLPSLTAPLKTLFQPQQHSFFLSAQLSPVNSTLTQKSLKTDGAHTEDRSNYGTLAASIEFRESVKFFASWLFVVNPTLTPCIISCNLHLKEWHLVRPFNSRRYISRNSLRMAFERNWQTRKLEFQLGNCLDQWVEPLIHNPTSYESIRYDRVFHRSG